MPRILGALGSPPSLLPPGAGKTWAGAEPPGSGVGVWGGDPRSRCRRADGSNSVERPTPPRACSGRVRGPAGQLVPPSTAGRETGSEPKLSPPEGSMPRCEPCALRLCPPCGEGCREQVRGTGGKICLSLPRFPPTPRNGAEGEVLSLVPSTRPLRACAQAQSSSPQAASTPSSQAGKVMSLQGWGETEGVAPPPARLASKSPRASFWPLRSPGVPPSVGGGGASRRRKGATTPLPTPSL